MVKQMRAQIVSNKAMAHLNHVPIQQSSIGVLVM